MLQKSSISKTAEIFFINPNKGHYLMDISRNVRLAHTSVKKNLKELTRLGMISESIEKKGRRRYPIYKANSDNRAFKRYKLIYNFSSILESGLIDLIEEKLTPKSIVLFGSYSKGEDIETSDIDLFVESKKEELNLKSFEKRLGRKIELHFKDDFTSYPKELKNNIINGVVLNGFLEGYK
ncbi:MAG: nucleotidyltransferase domain-containing protein [Candidatus Woesearchaeota archaeon]|nr:nucleotidyltransferase domain-containing protein [Candidatus Woesearchaeota archaeon]